MTKSLNLYSFVFHKHETEDGWVARSKARKASEDLSKQIRQSLKRAGKQRVSRSPLIMLKMMTGNIASRTGAVHGRSARLVIRYRCKG